MKEYAFDVKLFAVVRVRAERLDDAVKLMEEVVDSMTPTESWTHSFNRTKGSVRVTEVSLTEDGEYENREPYEITEVIDQP